MWCHFYSVPIPLHELFIWMVSSDVDMSWRKSVWIWWKQISEIKFQTDTSKSPSSATVWILFFGIDLNYKILHHRFTNVTWKIQPTAHFLFVFQLKWWRLRCNRFADRLNEYKMSVRFESLYRHAMNKYTHSICYCGLFILYSSSHCHFERLYYQRFVLISYSPTLDESAHKEVLRFPSFKKYSTINVMRWPWSTLELVYFLFGILHIWSPTYSIVPIF